MHEARTAGVLGGMGPDATVDFMAAVIAMTPATTDQQHVHMLVDHNPAVPDRQAALHGDRTAVSDALAAMALRLERAGADFLVMPCNTAHAFVGEILPRLRVPFVNIVHETVREIGERCAGVVRVGVLATTACLSAGLYQRELDACARTAILPDTAGQATLMEIVFRIKAGSRGSSEQRAMQALAAQLIARGAEVIVAGCTEIPLVLRGIELEVPCLSSTEILARRTVDIALGRSSLPTS